MSDTLADMITRIRNGQKANKVSIKAIYSKLNANVCDVLKNEGYIESFEVIGDNKKDLSITLKYYNGNPLINKIENSNNQPIVGERIKRSENLIFKICYQLHKLITLTFTGKSIKFGNFTCLPKSTVEKLINEKATWNSFSGSLTKLEDNLISIPSTRGKRYFGPSQMSFVNLLKHSLSIISVFRKTVLIRSALFIIFYILLIKSSASVITSLPLVLLLIMIYSISSLALRENVEEFNNSLTNIHDIDKIK